jgi:MFS family permease
MNETHPRLAGKAIYTLAVLTAVYCFAFVDRQILTMMVGPIRAQYHATDLQIAYLIGPAFILPFMAVGLPAGLAVDRFNRRNLVLGAGLVWSIGTGLAAFVDSYGALAATRAIVGGAEAILFPAGMSIIADLFDKRRLPVAYSVFLASPYIGGGMALVFGGLLLGALSAAPLIDLPVLGSIRGWQLTFLIVAVAGLIPVLFLTTIREVAREPAEGEQAASYPILDGLRYIAARWRFYLFFYLGMGSANLVNSMVAAWAPTLLTREFDLTSTQIGTSYGIFVLLAGTLGGLSCPLINRIIARRYPDSTMKTALIGPVLILVFDAILVLGPGLNSTRIALALFTFSYAFPLSVAGTSLQVVTPPSLRGTAAAIYLISNSIIGYSLGPTVVPLIARHLLGDADAIGRAIQLVGGGVGALALLFIAIAGVGFRGLVKGTADRGAGS